METFRGIAGGKSLIHANIFYFALSKFQVKNLVAVLILALAASGCVSRAKEKANAQAAYIAGQQAAYANMTAAQRMSVVVIGQVQKPEVPWRENLTLAQAIIAADYTGSTPKEIILLRQGETIRIDPKNLLRGGDVPLQPGDTITIRQ
jgi:hypothetical protein